MSVKKRLKGLLALFLAAVLCFVPSVAKADGQGAVLLYIKTSSENLKSGDPVTGTQRNVLLDEALDEQFKDSIIVPEGCQLTGWRLWSYRYNGCVTADWTKQLAPDGAITQADLSDCMSVGNGICNLLVEPLYGTATETPEAQAAVPVIRLDEEHVWKGFSGNIVFDNYFNRNKSLTISLEAETAGGSEEPAGDASDDEKEEDGGEALAEKYDIFYYLADSRTEGGLVEDGWKIATADRVEEVMEAKGLSWSEYEYEEEIDLTEEGRYVLYVKLVDRETKTGSYASTGGIVIDQTVPGIFRTGIGEYTELQNGAVCYGDVEFWARDDNLSVVTVDGKEMFPGLSYKIAADNKEHTIAAMDRAGNRIECKISVYEIWTLHGITKSGEYSLLPEVAYKLGNGGWRVAGDITVYYGGRSVYVSEKGNYFFKQR